MKLKVIKGDITTLPVDAIVNAANKDLTPGGGVCGAIHDAAGPGLAGVCQGIGRCATGEAVITQGFLLQAKYVIHTVGPIYEAEGAMAPSLLAACYENCLKIASDHKIQSIAFPCISTGIYGYPRKQAAEIAVETSRKFLTSHSKSSVRLVLFCCFDEYDSDIYSHLVG